MRVYLITLFLFTFFTTSLSAEEFPENPKVELLPGGREIKLLEDFVFIAPDGKKWTIPEGEVVDGASIPRIAWRLIGPPLTGKYRFASIIHDGAINNRMRSRNETNTAFHQAMLASGVNALKAKLMYAAVDKFCCLDWIKEAVEEGDVGEFTELDEEEFLELKNKIETREDSGNPMSLEEIREYKP